MTSNVITYKVLGKRIEFEVQYGVFLCPFHCVMSTTQNWEGYNFHAQISFIKYIKTCAFMHILYIYIYIYIYIVSRWVG